jgi:PAS domain S-box-containing protein
MITEPDVAGPDLQGLSEAVSLLAAVPDPDALLNAVIRLLRRWTDCEAVGVRLRQGEDYPYYTTVGFSEQFVKTENSLCAVDQAGEPVRDPAGRPMLECLCGAVIEGRFDPTQPFFSARGAFYTGSTSRLLAMACPLGLAGRTRNRCNASGYETVALIPLRAGGKTFGLLQINDRRPDRLGQTGIESLERLAGGVAMLLSRQEMDAALAAAEARYRAMFVANIAVKLLIDPETGSIVDANPAACDFYGYSLEELQKRSIWDINTMHPDHVREEMTRARDEGRGFFRFTHRLASGELREVAVFSGPVEFSGRTLLFSIIHDVTDQIRAEEARDQVEQMLRHDLRSPLAGIAGLAAHLAQADLPPSAREMAEVIQGTARRLFEMVGRNLDLCKIEQGRYVLSPAPVCLVPMLKRLACESSPLAERRRVSLVLGGEGLSGEEGGEVGPVAAGESDLLGTMFSNLVTNALEAAPPDTAVTITLSTSGACALVAIHNQGSIPEDLRSRFFLKYATSGKNDGTGLGAYTARVIARLHGGDIDWESCRERGTRLTVRLPRYDPRQSA